jgi:cytochrome c oxidase cbb3-type subunit 3
MFPVVTILTILAFADTPSPFANMHSDDLAKGRRLFEAQCAVCHGINGGGGSGANLAVTKYKRAADDPGLIEVIRNGVSGTSMPAAWWMSEREATQVAYYVKSLGRTTTIKVGGDKLQGKELFEGKGGCSGCHIANGKGGSLGPELTDIGARRSHVRLREIILNPGMTIPEGFLMVRVQPKTGPEIKGIRVNEDSFTIQIKDLTGQFRSFRKADLTMLNKDFGKTPMPSYDGKFSSNEMDNLVAYLVSLRGE